MALSHEQERARQAAEEAAVIAAQRQATDQLQADMPETLLELGKAEAATGEHASAEKHFRRVLEHELASSLAAAAHFQLAQLYRESGRLSEADRELKDFQALRRK